MSSFPASKYARYKRATAFFLDWLLRARGRGRHAGRRVELETFNDVVQEIAQDPSTLTPKLLQDLPKALAACQCAITLRERVATFFAEDDEAQDGHQHFLQLLRSWRDALKDVGVEQPGPAEQTTTFENYFAVLEVDEDFFPNEETFVEDRGATKKAKAERKKLFGQAFARDLQMEVVCYFTELEELVGGVFNIYDEVKKQKRTMMEATVVGTLALHMANTLTAKLQLRYPELKLAEDLVGVLVCYPSASLGAQTAKAVAEVRESFDKDGTATFVPGTLLHDFTNVLVTLSLFAKVFPPLGAASPFVGLPDGYFGANYGEERTPEYVFPDVNHYVVLLSQQLPHLYNMILVMRAEMGPGLDGQTGLVVDFMKLLEVYFETRQVTIPLVFLCICWMQSVAALQGDAGLSRNVSLTIKHTEDLIKVVEAAMSKNPLPVPVRGDSYHAVLRDTRDGYEASLRSNSLARANPLFAGSQMMSNHLEYLIVGNSYITPTCRAFCHLYNALVKQGFLKPIQFFDEMLDIYGGMIFARSSHAAAQHGSFDRVYLLAMNVTGSSIDAMYDMGSVVGTFNRTRMQHADPNMLSLTYRLMDDDMSFLKGVASKTMLQKAADVCTKEMFESRILSRDLMTLSDDVEELFSAICDALGRQAIRDDYVATFPAAMPREVKLQRAVELTVMIPLLSLVDGLRPDGSLDSSLIPELQVIGDVVVDGEFVRRMLTLVAAVIEARFTSEICEEKYFTFPSRPDFVNQEYGMAAFKAKTTRPNRERVFNELMSLMQGSKAHWARRSSAISRRRSRRTRSS
jgi:hypothetical protein